ncbi:MAG: formylmethanofuran dehydrogenase subunit C [Pirellulaceae bacterium]
MIQLTLKVEPQVPLQCEVLSPDVLGTLTKDQIARLPVVYGRRERVLGDFFDIEGDNGDELRLSGDLHRVRWIGKGMSRGKITIAGDAGMHLGSGMSGGTIVVEGSVDHWLGAEMTGGFIVVNGNAGSQIGGAYTGSLVGMREGTILVRGDAGHEVGMRMRRGLIAIGGVAGDLVGMQMKGGTIALLSGAGRRCGAWMNRGTIISLSPLEILPTFRYGAIFNPTFMHLYAKYLGDHGFQLPYRAEEGCFDRYSGDATALGKGELLIWTT